MCLLLVSVCRGVGGAESLSLYETPDPEKVHFFLSFTL